MREDWKAATEYIKDLETINDLQSAEIEELRSMLAAAKAQIADLNDLQSPEIEELRSMLAAAKAQIADLLRDRRAPDLRAIV